MDSCNINRSIENPRKAKTLHHNRKEFVRGGLLILFSSFMFALMNGFAKKSMQKFSPYEITLARCVLGILVIIGWNFLGNRLRPQKYFRLAFRGFLGVGGIFFLFLSMKKLPLGMATLLNYQSPVFTSLFCVLFLGEKFSRNIVFAFLLSGAGVFLIVYGSPKALITEKNNWVELIPYVAMGITSAALSGAASATIRALSGKEGPWEIFGALCVIGTSVSLPLSLADWVWPSGIDWLYLMGMGIASVLGQLALTYGLIEISAIYASVIMQISPMITVFIGILWFGESLTLFTFAGAILTFVGVGVGLFTQQQKSQKS